MLRLGGLGNMSWAGQWGPLRSRVPKLWAGFSPSSHVAHIPLAGVQQTHVSPVCTKAGAVNGALNSH